MEWQENRSRNKNVQQKADREVHWTILVNRSVAEQQLICATLTKVIKKRQNVKIWGSSYEGCVKTKML